MLFMSNHKIASSSKWKGIWRLWCFCKQKNPQKKSWRRHFYSEISPLAMIVTKILVVFIEEKPFYFGGAREECWLTNVKRGALMKTRDSRAMCMQCRSLWLSSLRRRIHQNLRVCCTFSAWAMHLQPPADTKWGTPQGHSHTPHALPLRCTLNPTVWCMGF